MFQKEDLFVKLLVHFLCQAFSPGQKVVCRNQCKWHTLFLLSSFSKFIQQRLAAWEARQPSLSNIF